MQVGRFARNCREALLRIAVASGMKLQRWFLVYLSFTPTCCRTTSAADVLRVILTSKAPTTTANETLWAVARVAPNVPKPETGRTTHARIPLAALPMYACQGNRKQYEWRATKRNYLSATEGTHFFGKKHLSKLFLVCCFFALQVYQYTSILAPESS